MRADTDCAVGGVVQCLLQVCGYYSLFRLQWLLRNRCEARPRVSYGKRSMPRSCRVSG